MAPHKNNAAVMTAISVLQDVSIMRKAVNKEALK